MNQIVKSLKEQSAQAGTAKQWKLEELCKMAALEIESKAAENARLTASHAMQGEELVTLPRHMVYGMEDKLKAQAEEISTLKGHLAAIETITALSDYKMSFKSFEAIREHTLSAGAK